MVLSLPTVSVDTLTLESFELSDEFLPSETGVLAASALLLSSEQRYHAELTRYTPLGLLSSEQKDDLAERARQGDRQARADVIQCLLHAVECFAARYFQTYSWVSARLEYSEFVQVGNEALCLALDRALETNHPYAYLLTVAYHAIRKFAWRTRSLIATPAARKGSEVTALPVISLDAPLTEHQEQTLQDLLAASASLPSASGHDSQPLRAAIEQLPPSLRTVICRLFGLGGMGRERVFELCTDLDGGSHSFEAVERQKERALVFLYLRLQTTYPHLALSAEQAGSAELPGHLKLVQRLEQAYLTLQASGEPMSAARLAKEARVEAYLAGEFLRQRGQDWASQQARRLDEAYHRLQTCGEPLTTRQLVKEARVDWPMAREYLRQHGVVRDRETVNHTRSQERAERLERAYRELVTTGQQLTVRALASAAHIEPLVAGAYLRAMHGQAAEVPA